MSIDFYLIILTIVAAAAIITYFLKKQILNLNSDSDQKAVSEELSRVA